MLEKDSDKEIAGGNKQTFSWFKPYTKIKTSSLKILYHQQQNLMLKI